jgi:hypothetical protein
MAKTDIPHGQDKTDRQTDRHFISSKTQANACMHIFILIVTSAPFLHIMMVARTRGAMRWGNVGRWGCKHDVANRERRFVFMSEMDAVKRVYMYVYVYVCLELTYRQSKS